MQFDIDNTTLLFISGVIVLTASLMLHLRKRWKNEAEKKTKRHAAIQAAREAERKRQIQTGAPIKIKPGSLAPDRIPFAEPYNDTFSGSVSPRNIAKWEAEIDQIGRQMIGRLDSKMVALQTLTLEANRAANRLELLVEHLERLHTAFGPAAASQPELPLELPEEIPEQAEQPNLLPAGESNAHLEAFTDVLQDLESELDRFRNDLDEAIAPGDEPVLPATVLKSEELPKKEPMDERRLPPTIALSTGSPLDESIETPEESKSPLSLSSPRLPGESAFSDLPPNIRLATDDPRPAVLTGSKRITVTATKPAMRSSTGLSLNSLYENRAFDNEPEFAAPVAIPQQLLKEGSRLALRKQVEMLADYGYTANQIAQNLNITVGEVDLMLSLRG